jgi:hypothetical protein
MRRSVIQARGIDGDMRSHRDPAHYRFGLALLLWTCWMLATVAAVPASGQGTEEMQIEITKIGLGKEVVITQGPMEWFMRVEVTPENTVVVRQEKQGEQYLVDESETHDRSMTAAEVDGAITDFINHVKVKRQKP